MSTLEDRLTELEVRMAFIDDAVVSLNAAVASQDRASLQMRHDFERLRSELVGLRSSLSQDAGVEPPPPHY